MPKPKGKGGKNRRRGKGVSDEKHELIRRRRGKVNQQGSSRSDSTKGKRNIFMYNVETKKDCCL
jgi:hypothetical protein